MEYTAEWNQRLLEAWFNTILEREADNMIGHSLRDRKCEISDKTGTGYEIIYSVFDHTVNTGGTTFNNEVEPYFTGHYLIVGTLVIFRADGSEGYKYDFEYKHEI